jgi:hypothetical protein
VRVLAARGMCVVCACIRARQEEDFMDELKVTRAGGDILNEVGSTSRVRDDFSRINCGRAHQCRDARATAWTLLKLNW